MTVQINSGLVRALLGKKNMTIPELAEQTGVSRQTIYNLLNGKPFDVETLGKLASTLDVSPSRLIDPEEAVVS